MLKGWKKPLKAEDLYNLKPSDSAKAINEIWESNWTAENHQCTGVNDIHNHPKASILWPLFKCFGGTFLVASAIRLTNILIQVGSFSELLRPITR